MESRLVFELQSASQLAFRSALVSVLRSESLLGLESVSEYRSASALRLESPLGLELKSRLVLRSESLLELESASEYQLVLVLMLRLESPLGLELESRLVLALRSGSE